MVVSRMGKFITKREIQDPCLCGKGQSRLIRAPRDQPLGGYIVSQVLYHCSNLAKEKKKNEFCHKKSENVSYWFRHQISFKGGKKGLIKAIESYVHKTFVN